MGIYDKPQGELLASIVKGQRSVDNREQLGPLVPIRLFQALRIVGMGTALESMVGGGARAMVYQSGQALGMTVGGVLAPSANGDLNKYVASLAKLCADLRIGVISAEKVDLDNGLITIAVNECVSCAGLQADKPICHFEAGMVGGMVRAFTGGNAKGVEVRCHAIGDDCCAVDVHLL